jgi:hypothetical protein
MTYQAGKTQHTSMAALTALLCVMVLSPDAAANDRDQAKRIHDRLVGTPPSELLLDEMESLVADDRADEAALLATQQDDFYNTTLKNFVTPWTNEARDPFAPLNDYTTTVIGAVMDDLDFRRVLYDNLLYVGDAGALSTDGYSVPAPSATTNDHFAALESQNVPLQDYLVQTTQTAAYGTPAEAVAGVMTSRAAAKAFFVAGTNRAMIRFTFINHMCRDLEQVKDLSRPADRVRQDVSRSPGGDSRIYLNSCVGCHSGMDPLTQAFAYHEWSGEEGTEDGQLLYNGPGMTDPETGSRVQAKNRINANNFPFGYVTEDDGWINYWREGQNANLGWDTSLPGNGNGASSLGRELAHSDAFSDCQARKVFRTVCLREPADSNDINAVATMSSDFQSGGYVLRDLFTDAAVYCAGD